MSQPITLEVLATRFDNQHEDLVEVKAGMKQVLAALPTLASRDEVTSLRQEVSTYRAENRAMETRLRAVEDTRTAWNAVLAVVGVLGVGGIGALLKWILAT